MADPLSRLPPPLLSMIAQGVSVLVTSRDAQMRPSVTRAVGSSVDRERGAVTVYLSRLQSPQLLRDVEAGAPLAVMFSQPSTHKTVQMKSTRAQLRDAHDGDRAALAAYLAAMEREIESVGHSARFARAVLAHHLEDLVALTFEPREIFDQTPGAQAGARLAGEGA